MPIAIGDSLPDGTLMEFIETATQECAVGPHAHTVAELAHGKTIALFAVPGAFTPTCSNQHLPGYLRHYDALRARGVDEIWCVAVNDAFVMGAWGRAQQVAGKIRMLADGSATWTRKMGLSVDLGERGFGIRSKRYSALVRNGIIEQLNIEAPGKFEVSDAQTLLEQLS